MELNRQKRVDNELTFKRRNRKAEQMVKAEIGEREAKHWALHFCCECSDQKCDERIEMTVQEYGLLHKNPRQFMVKPGHEDPEIETVAQPYFDFIVVKKNVHLIEGM